MTLLLWDIDGTLLGRAATAHAQSLREAIAQVHAVDVSETRHQLSPAGRTDGEIARALLLAAGVSARAIDDHAEDVRAACCEIFAQRCPDDLSDKVIPGIADLLDELSARDDVRLSLVTGNYEPVARIKLGHAGIGRHFPSGQGGFGSDAEDRAMLPGIARKRAGQDGVAFPREQTVVIGDTPRDIACARADGVRCFAVTTGPFEAPELTDADAVAADEHELRSLLSSI